MQLSEQQPRNLTPADLGRKLRDSENCSGKVRDKDRIRSAIATHLASFLTRPAGPSGRIS